MNETPTDPLAQCQDALREAQEFIFARHADNKFRQTILDVIDAALSSGGVGRRYIACEHCGGSGAAPDGEVER